MYMLILIIKEEYIYSVRGPIAMNCTFSRKLIDSVPVVTVIARTLEYNFSSVIWPNREAEMREVSEATNSRVAWFSIMAIGLCIVVSVLQLWHLTRYFQKKKLI